MKIGIIGVNKISKFYAIIFSQYGHEVILYESDSPTNSLAVERILLEENFFTSYIKDLSIFEMIEYIHFNLSITEKYLFKKSVVDEKFVEIKNYKYTNDFNFDKLPNVEIVPLNSKSINQIKMMEDILILDSPDSDIINQLDLSYLNDWIAIYIEADKNSENFQITKQGKYSILALENEKNKTIFINTVKRKKKEVLKLISKMTNNYKIINEEKIIKYDKYAYKNIAIVNTALLEYNYPYRDYSLLFQIIQKTEPKKVFANLDIYSDIKSQVI